MSDLERDLRTLLDEKAAGVGAPMPDARLLRRARRRQVGTVVGGTVVALAIVAGVVVAVSAFGPSDRRTPAAPTGPLADTTVNGVTVTHPQSWKVVDPVEAGIQPESQTPTQLILLMTDAEEITAEAISCPALSDDERRDGVVMTIQEQPLALAGEDATPWPVDLVPLVDPADNPSGCLPGWTFLRGSWTVSGRSFEARVGFGPDVSDEQRNALEAAYASMRFAPPESEPEAVVLATGTAGGEDWELIAQHSTDDLYLGLEWSTGGSGMGGMADIPDPVQYGATFVGTGPDKELVLFGATRDPVVRVEYAPSDGGPAVSADVIDVPEAIDDRLDAFILAVPDSGTADAAGMLRGYDERGSVVAEIEVPIPAGDGEPSPEVVTNGGVVVGSGEDWALSVDDGAGLCLDVTAPQASEGSCTDVWNEEVGTADLLALPGDRALVYGFLQPAADLVRIRLEDGSIVETNPIAPPQGFAYEAEAFAVELEGASGAGRISILDDAGDQIGFADFEWAPGQGNGIRFTPIPA